jgi:hypothetical protein
MTEIVANPTIASKTLAKSVHMSLFICIFSTFGADGLDLNGRPVAYKATALPLSYASEEWS